MTVNTLGTDPRSDRDAVQPGSRTAAGWLWPFVVGGLALFSISALFYYHFHRLELLPQSFLQQMFAGMYDTFGWAPSVVFFLLVFAWSLIWFVTGVLDRPGVRLVRLLVMAVMLGLFLNLGDGGVAWEPHKGAFGAWLGGRLVAAVGYVPSLVLVWITTFASLLLATDWFFSEWFERPAAKSTGEAGVEDAVTDHLRGLGQDPAAAAPKASADEASAETRSLEQQALDLLSKTGLLDEVVEPPRVEGPPRSSYAERRRLREERATVEEPAEHAVEEEAVSEAEFSSLLGASASSSADAALEDGDFVVIAPEHLEAEEVVLGDEDGEESSADAEDVAEEPVGVAHEAREVERLEGEGVVEEADQVIGLGHEEAEESSEDAEVEEDVEEDADLDYEEEESEEEELEDEGDEEVDLEYEEVEASSGDAEVEEDAEEGADLDYEEEESEEEELEDEADEEVELDYEEVEASSGDAEAEEDAEEDADLDYEEEESEEEELGDEEDEEVDLDYEEVEASSEDVEVEEDAEEDADLDDEEEDAEEEALEEEVELSYEDEVEYEVDAGSEAAYAEVAIPRPEEPVPAELPTQPELPAEREEQRQQKLFGGGVDEGLVQEAQELLARGRRPTASLLQRKLRIDYELAQDLLQELERRGLVAADGRRG